MIAPNSTPPPKLEIDLIPAPNDAEMFSREYQTVLNEFSRVAKPTSQRAFAMDAIDAVGGPLGEYAFKLAGILIPTVTAAVVAYISGRAGRKVKIKFADIEIEASSIEQVDAALKLIEERQERRERLVGDQTHRSENA